MSQQILEIRAGKRALLHLQANGLQPEHVKSIYGASGAAKWLAIAGLDSAVFADWLPKANQSISLYGTSIGAIKLAAAVQSSPRQRLASLAGAYIEQSYAGRPTPETIASQTTAILDAALGSDGVKYLLNNPRFNYFCGAVHCKQSLSRSSVLTQNLTMLGLAAQALVSRDLLNRELDRVIFGNRSAQSEEGMPLSAMDAFHTQYFQLTETNLHSAILASGSIPVYMRSVEMEVQPNEKDPESKLLCLRDGGILDYHPIPDNVSADNRDGIVLYPHFYSQLRETWFDKFYPWRKVGADRLQDVVLISPSQYYLDSLKLGRIPDRADFSRYAGRDPARISLWTDAWLRSEELGDSWLELCARQDWSRVQPL